MSKVPPADGVGESKRPPCESCHRTRSECILVESRRGAAASHRTRQQTSQTSPLSQARGTIDDNSGDAGPFEGSSPDGPGPSLTSPSNNCSAMSEDFESRETVEADNLHMEIRNPSDALQILAHVRDDPGGQGRSEKQWHAVDADVPSNSIISQKQSHSPFTTASVSSGNRMNPGRNTQDNDEVSTVLLDDYELVQRGLLHPSVLPELLHLYARHYHPYCPIVPPYMLGPQAMTKIRRSDYFLLTAILAVASRDMPGHVLVHRYCWDHAQRLLLEVLLAHSWAQTPRTVQAILLLAEWIPYQIKQDGTESPKSLLSEDRSAWSLIGLAVRQGYLLRLDRAAFPSGSSVGREASEIEEEKRLIWTYRQISVRMGQSFWSRGPSLSSKLTNKDFPNLKSLPGMEEEDLASALQAKTELTQILYNAHGILYSSTERTLAMVNDGDYARYLDDFQRSTTNWYAAWNGGNFSSNVRATLLLLYEYVCLYVNAFSFQAVLTRASGERSQRRDVDPGKGAAPFLGGLMCSPDGPYVYEAISCARKILGLMNQLHPRNTLRFLPTRFYLYGVYAAVFLYKAQCAGAFQSVAQRQENSALAGRFISKLEQISQDELHLCRRYSVMLGRIWRSRDSQRPFHDGTVPRLTCPEVTTTVESNSIIVSMADETNSQTSWPTDGGQNNWNYVLNEWDQGAVDTMQYNTDAATMPDIEGYFLGSFFPGVTGVDFQHGFGETGL
uniref:Transcription factor domain-containing protein n=1 Tax=Bionectria ochroleuca TaxID=29856 RepID=A0A0B7KLK5_BIOOC